MKNHDENSSAEYSSISYKEYYAIIMTYAPKMINQIADKDIKLHLNSLISDPVGYLEKSGKDIEKLSNDHETLHFEKMI